MPVRSTRLNLQLRNEYNDLFASLQINPQKISEINATAKRITDNRSRYEQVSALLNIPWYFIGIVHTMEASGNFTKHLHNGDPLKAKTVQVPKGRPKVGIPPFTWEESAMDALEYEGYKNATGWNPSAFLFRFERYNGFGYRNKYAINSPYLWSYSQHYSKGKYTVDGSFDPKAVSKQIGAAILLKQLSTNKELKIKFDEEPEISLPEIWKVKYDPKNVNPVGIKLQLFLNQFGFSLNPDGKPGKNTSDAVFEFSGNYLIGDPRKV